jgi:gamma-glutamyltranspeptidase
VASGDLQDQTSLNVLLNHIEFGMSAQQAVTAPRFYIIRIRSTPIPIATPRLSVEVNSKFRLRFRK